MSNEARSLEQQARELALESLRRRATRPFEPDEPPTQGEKIDILPALKEQVKHDGKLGGRNPYSVCCVIGKRTHYAGVRIGHDEVTSTEIWLSPAQALSLLAWLKQEEAELQRLAKEQQS